jgi:hypothetical protein
MYKVGDRVVWLDPESKIRELKGIVIKVLGQLDQLNIVIEWENGRTIQYHLVQLQHLKTKLQIDKQYYRNQKLESII